MAAITRLPGLAGSLSARPRGALRASRSVRCGGTGRSFISDVHLGTPRLQAELLADFWCATAARTLFLVGDIVDGWRLKRRWYWPDAHNRVIEALLRKIDAGNARRLRAGNHDEVLRIYCRRSIRGRGSDVRGGSRDGRRLGSFWCCMATGSTRSSPTRNWLAHLGDGAYTMALHLNESLPRAAARN